MPNLNLTNTARLKGRELLRRPRFPALFPADRGALKPWTVGEGYLYRFDHEFFGVGVPARAFCHDRMSFYQNSWYQTEFTLDRFAT